MIHPGKLIRKSFHNNSRCTLSSMNMLKGLFKHIHYLRYEHFYRNLGNNKTKNTLLELFDGAETLIKDFSNVMISPREEM